MREKFQFVGCRSMMRDALLDSEGVEEGRGNLLFGPLGLWLPNILDHIAPIQGYQ